MYMRKIWKILGVCAILIAMVSTTSAWNPGWGWPTVQNEVSTDDVVQKAEEILKNADVEEFFSYKYDTMHYRIINGGEYVGVLWEDVKLSDLTTGEPYPTMWGWRVPLIYNENVVGQLFVDGEPGLGYGYGHRYCGGFGSGFINKDIGQKHGTDTKYSHTSGYRAHGFGMMHGGWW